MAVVKIYTTPSCVFCKMAKAFFKEQKIEYQELDIATNAKARDEMIQRSGQFGVPVIDIDGKLVIGFDKRQLLGLLVPNA